MNGIQSLTYIVTFIEPLNNLTTRSTFIIINFCIFRLTDFPSLWRTSDWHIVSSMLTLILGAEFTAYFNQKFLPKCQPHVLGGVKIDWMGRTDQYATLIAEATGKWIITPLILYTYLVNSWPKHNTVGLFGIMMFAEVYFIPGWVFHAILFRFSPWITHRRLPVITVALQDQPVLQALELQ